MVNIIILEQNGTIKTVEIEDSLKKDDLKPSQYTKNQVKFIHKWKLNNILEINNNELSLNIYAKNKSNGLDINKHDLPPPLHNLDNVYYGNILIVGLDDDDNIINFEKDHWKSLVKILNKEEEDDEEDDEDEDEDEEDEDDIDFIVNSSEDSDCDELEDEEFDFDNIKEYEQIIGKQTVTIFRLKQRIKNLEEKSD
tara:strand:+ start:421 stop:1008 length:588 start_codon:yes stop_codon:yes gene_type:complete